MTTTHPTAFVSTRVITEDLEAMVDFYELLTGTTAVRPATVFAEIVTPTATLAIGTSATVPLFAHGSAEAAANRSAILELLVDDVDAEHARLAATGVEIVAEPALMPWGNRVFFLRDPDQNLVGVFSPVTAEAVERLAGRYDRSGPGRRAARGPAPSGRRGATPRSRTHPAGRTRQDAPSRRC